MRVRPVLSAALAAIVLTACGASIQPVAPPSATELQDAEAEIFALLNDSREEVGLAALVRDPALDEVARAWSGQLAASGELEHNPAYSAEIPDGWSESGENVGWVDPATQDLDGLPAALHEAWLESPTHRANLEDPAYTTVGIGMAYDQEHGYYVTQDFAAYPD